MGLWVDTDFGFDDLWALLVLEAEGVAIDGVSLVAGNSQLEQVCANAFGAIHHFGFSWPIYKGADGPLSRPLETAERILGPKGMRSRGQFLPLVPAPPVQEALPALASWLDSEGTKDLLAIGPLTNLALAYQSFPDKLQRLRSLTWMGGSRARGNHTEHAEYNAFADADALATVLQHGAPLRVVDLELCRQVTFGPADAPVLEDGLLADLLGGYLDIALSRGRERMAIYDPIAALAVVQPSLIKFERVNLSVYTENDARYGQTDFNFVQSANASIGTGIDPKIALQICMKALKQRQNQ